MGKEHADSKFLRRVSQACARCKVKKVKCCASKPCSRCKTDDALCFYGVRGANDKRLVSKIHVDRLQWQQKILMKALRALWKKHERPLQQADADYEEPSIHAIVAATGVLDHEPDKKPISDSRNIRFDENLLLSSKSSSCTRQGGHSVSDDGGANWSPTDAMEIDLSLLDVEDQDEYLEFDYSLIENLSDGTFNGDAAKGELPMAASLAERRGAIWLPKCIMPPVVSTTKGLSKLPNQHALLMGPYDESSE